MEPLISFIDSSLGLLRVYDESNINQISKESITLNHVELTPGQKTTLDNFFNSEVIYLGLFNGFMQFEIGRDTNLFSTTIWCNEFKKIDEKTILNIYQVGTARDYIFKNGKWK